MNRRNLTTLITFLLLAFVSGAQTQWWIGCRGVLAYSNFRECGVSPSTYRGIAAAPDFNIVINTPRWRIIVNNNLMVGGYENAQKPRFDFTSVAGYDHLRAKFLHPIDTLGRWTLLGGASVNEWAWLSYNSNLFNANMGFANLIDASLHFRAEYTVTRNARRRQLSRRWMLHGDLSCAPVGVFFRPGFAYIDNYNATSESTASVTLSSYEWHLKALPAVTTDFGISRLLDNGNRIGIGYGWNFVSSGNATAASFFTADHQLYINFDFAL